MPQNTPRGVVLDQCTDKTGLVGSNLINQVRRNIIQKRHQRASSSAPSVAFSTSNCTSSRKHGAGNLSPYPKTAASAKDLTRFIKTPLSISLLLSNTLTPATDNPANTVPPASSIGTLMEDV